MAMTVSELVLKIRSEGLEKLLGIGDAARVADQSVKGAELSLEKLERQLSVTAKATALAERAGREYEQRIRSIDAAVQRGAYSEAEATRLRESAVVKLTAARERSVRTAEAEQRAHDNMLAEIKGYETAIPGATRSFGNFRGALAGVGYQIQDAAVQLQMGTNAFTVIAQQGSQMASAFGPAGVAIGTVAALAGTAAGVLFNLGGETEDAASAASLMGRAYADLGDDVTSLTAKFEHLNAVQRNLEEINVLSAVKAGRTELGTTVDALGEAIRDSLPSDIFGGLGISEKLKPVTAALKAIKDETIPVDQGLVNVEIALRRTGLSAGFVETATMAAAGAVGEAGHEVERLEAVMAVLNGTATAAQRDLLNFAVATKTVAEMTREATSELRDGYESAIKSALPERAASLELESRRVDVMAALEGGVIGFGEAQRALSAIELEHGETIDRINNSLSAQDKAYRTTSDSLDRQIEAVQGRIDAISMGTAVQREANDAARIANELARAHVEVGTEEATMIAAKVEELSRLERQETEGNILTTARERLSLVERQVAAVRSGLRDHDGLLGRIRAETEAVRKFGDATSDGAREWLAINDAIAEGESELKRVTPVEEFPEGVADELNTMIEEAFS